MSSVMENRAAVFTSQPQVVEVFQAGAWWAGELLGWRHDEKGACQVWVRAVVDGLERTAWTDLAVLRLPERSVGTSAQPAGRRAVQDLPTRQVATPAPHRRRVDVETTASLPLARDHVTQSAPVSAGGRRRAPEDVDLRPAPASAVPVPPGRHRAPSADPDAGRHRAADTELFPAVVAESAPAHPSEQFPPTAAWSVPAARPVPVEETIADVEWGGAGDQLLTRPMRLTDQAPHSRRPRLVAH
ncbi:hypothetical protein GCU60_13480 [Blastococcus saxobsidens]|uniref:Uncharacterized protein n=1 Tax=Blastococcus saxobsidens TaxID=138336 RepID=A0A6L9W3S8_9ACTN|nr:hypothetical protein [Blastococcus saxobsidens]NEK86756.1 hypothetical protein [Blastococcus saxobsidens]